MYVHLFSRGEDFFQEKLNVDDACKLIELQETVEEEEHNFIGFTHPRSEDAMIQFVRMATDEWVLDIPTYKDGDYKGTYLTEINHSLTLTIVVEFYHQTPLQQAIINANYEQLLKIFRERWKIEFNFEIIE